MHCLIEKSKASTRAERAPRSEVGDTLIEVLLALVILGLASVALLLAFGTSISSSAEHRSLTTFDTVLRTASEEAISQIQNQQPNSLFGTCPVLNGTPALDRGELQSSNRMVGACHFGAVLECHKFQFLRHLRGHVGHVPRR
jgi:type II secretory pathway pseudopilin PulG